jgi:Lrp/AsnC family transcriptional regulator, leucine-responsive regulatory protein
VIRQYTAIVDPRTIGLDVTAFISVVINGSKYYPAFAQRVTERPEILECHSVTGQGSHLLKIRTDSTTSLERLLADIQSWPGVQSTTTSVVLSTVKEVAGPRWKRSLASCSRGRARGGHDGSRRVVARPVSTQPLT